VAGLRALLAAFPDAFSLADLARRFGVGYEAMRRIAKSNTLMSPEQQERVRDRWVRRGARIWAHRAAAEGAKPPARWRAMGVGEVRAGAPLPRWKQAEWWKENVEDVVAEGGEAGRGGARG
jgi:Zn-dependent peptidase ImmA (M78 family)